MRRAPLLQLARFGAVGVSNTVLSFVVYALALRVGVRYLPAGAGAFAVGGVNGFVLNRSWTFGARGSVLRAGSRYAVVQVVGLFANDFSTPLKPGEKWSDVSQLRTDYVVSYGKFLAELHRRSPDAAVLAVWHDLEQDPEERVNLAFPGSTLTADQSAAHERLTAKHAWPRRNQISSPMSRMNSRHLSRCSACFLKSSSWVA